MKGTSAVKIKSETMKTLLNIVFYCSSKVLADQRPEIHPQITQIKTNS
jgi:hypothetical protein